MVLLSDSVTELKGVGNRLAQKLHLLGVETLWDLLLFFPFRYQNRSLLSPISCLKAEQEFLIQATISSTEIIYAKKRILHCFLNDDSGAGLMISFFNFNRNMQASFREGREILCFGKINYGPMGLQMIHPEFQFIENTRDLEKVLTYLPIYHLTEGLHQNQLRKLIQQAVNILIEGAPVDLLPANIRQKQGFPDFCDAIKNIHFPDTRESFEMVNSFQSRSAKALIFEELLANQLLIMQIKKTSAHDSFILHSNTEKTDHLNAFISSLAFNLTRAQQRAYQDILADVKKNTPMHRLIQGDVGSGKTIVAALAALMAINKGYQACIMAPTEILAKQHLHSFSRWFEPLGISIAFLSGTMKVKERKQTLSDIAKGSSKMIIGTHALFQQSVHFHALALIIIDEQHRFGVEQRLRLKQKGVMLENGQLISPHILVMTATPIPRTLMMSIYADLDCSVIDELPPGRLPVETVAIASNRRAELIQRISSVCLDGRQVYWICPLIEESEILQCEAAENTFQQLKQHLSGVSIGLIHGKMSADDKLQIMEKFQQEDIQLLVATTVIEVGVNVPNASLMIIENSERLGLSQLHQLRGRVGRGSIKSVCVLIYSSPLGRTAKKRIEIMRSSNDGFTIAEEDLKIRGPGELSGSRQSGFTQMKIADSQNHTELLGEASKLAEQLMDQDYPCIEQIIQRWNHVNDDFADI